MKERNDMLTLKEASKYLKISTQSLSDLAIGKKIPAFKVGRMWRFRKSSIDRWVERQENGS